MQEQIEIRARVVMVSEDADGLACCCCGDAIYLHQTNLYLMFDDGERTPEPLARYCQSCIDQLTYSQKAE